MNIVAISGSLREGSSNAALLRAAARVAPEGVSVSFYEGMGSLPHFNPDLDAEGSVPPPEVKKLRETLIAADAILISSPEYAHGLPGALKNMLDWLVSTGELVDKPIALLNASPSGGQYAQAALDEVLRTMNWRLIEEASRVEPFVPRRLSEELTDEEALASLRQAMHALARVVNIR